MSDEDRAQFSVYQYFRDGGYERTDEHVDKQRACDRFAHFTQSVGAKVGAVVKVMMTDGGDDCCMLWEYGRGVTFPPELVNIDLSRRKP